MFQGLVPTAPPAPTVPSVPALQGRSGSQSSLDVQAQADLIVPDVEVGKECAYVTVLLEG